MILYDSNFLNEKEIEYILSFWSDTKFDKYREQIIYFDGIELINKCDFKLIKNNLFASVNFNTIRLQRSNETIHQLTFFHGHNDIHNYVIFLNDDFEGGELEFEEGLLIKPKKGSVVYFCNNERHRVKNCVGNRFSLVMSGNHSISLDNFSVRKRNGLI